MIIVGSYASKLGEFTPPWRNGRAPKDVDIFCRYADIDYVRLATHGDIVKSGDFIRLIYSEGVQFELTLFPPDIMDLLERLCPHAKPVEINPFEICAQIAPVEVVWTTLYLTARFDKSFRDLAYYHTVARPTDDHRKLAMRFREVMIDRITRSM